MSLNLSDLSAANIGRRLQAKTLDPVDVTEYFLSRIEAHPDQSVFTTLMRAQAIEAAKLSRKRHQNNATLGLFDGVPIAWKDLFDIIGVPTSAGSKLYMQEGPARQNAVVVRRLLDIGTVPLGKTNLSEFAFSGVGVNPHFGTPIIANDYVGDDFRSPINDNRHIPGGSSCGAAVALGCGLAPIATGTDTSGSVRVPASFNGLVGHHSSPGRYPTDGVFCLSPTLDTVGTLAKTVEDCLLMDCAYRGEDLKLECALALSGLKILVPDNYVCDDCDPDVIANFEDTMAHLAARNVEVVRHVIPEIDYYADIMAQHGALVTAEAYFGRQQDLKPPRSDMIDPVLVTRLRLAETMSAVDLVTIFQARKKLHDSLMAYLSDGYVLAMPTAPHTAPLLQPLLDDPVLFAKTNLKLIRNTMIGSIAGLCGLTLPTGKDRNGLSIGTLFCGAPDTDRQLLRFGLSLSEVLEAKN